MHSTKHRNVVTFEIVVAHFQFSKVELKLKYMENQYFHNAVKTIYHMDFKKNFLVIPLM